MFVLSNTNHPVRGYDGHMKITAVLIVEKVESSLAVLGGPAWAFEKTVEVPEGDVVGFAIVEKDGAELMLQSPCERRRRTSRSSRDPGTRCALHRGRGLGTTRRKGSKATRWRWRSDDLLWHERDRRVRVRRAYRDLRGQSLGRYFLITSSKNASARGSRECCSDVIACLRISRSAGSCAIGSGRARLRRPASIAGRRARGASRHLSGSLSTMPVRVAMTFGPDLRPSPETACSAQPRVVVGLRDRDQQVERFRLPAVRQRGDGALADARSGSLAITFFTSVQRARAPRYETARRRMFSGWSGARKRSSAASADGSACIAIACIAPCRCPRAPRTRCQQRDALRRLHIFSQCTGTPPASISQFGESVRIRFTRVVLHAEQDRRRGRAAPGGPRRRWL